jgi:dipeptidase D
VLEKYSDNRALLYFEKMTEIPRCSGNEKAVSDWLVKFARDRELEVHQDKALNVIIKKSGSKGRENHSPVILQGHMDMVCVKEESCEFDFEKDAIPIDVDGDWIVTKGTTLGADNGIAVAMILALLDDMELEHPPIEALITTNEEVGLLGATAVNGELFHGRTLINLDSEEEGVFLTSCAGGVRNVLTLPARWKQNKKKNAFEITIRGLLGGHSGMEIHKGRANANRLMGRLLEEVGGGARIAFLEGGEKMNAIPSKARAIITMNGSPESVVKKMQRIFSQEYRVNDPDIIIELRETELPEKAVSSGTTEKIIALLQLIPDGVQSMSQEVDGLVETSSNLGVVRLTDREVLFENAHRSSVESKKVLLIKKFEQLAILAGAGIIIQGNYPGWQYSPVSPIRELFMKTYKEITGKDAIQDAVHAGLECGILQEKLKEADVISLGPDMLDVHTPNERLSISSTERTYALLTEVLRRL